MISIHSAARAETLSWTIAQTVTIYFNPLRREGGDKVMVIVLWSDDNFNPLRREGGDII